MAVNLSKSKVQSYFGYGSNLWKDQMKERCPTSTYLGIARLNGYRWIINERGYANVVETFETQKGPTNEVWGLVFELQPTDEDKLDINEGVPEDYTKEDLTVDFWPERGDKTPKVEDRAQKIEMLVYINRKRLEPSVPKKEYIYRMYVKSIDKDMSLCGAIFTLWLTLLLINLGTWESKMHSRKACQLPM